VLRRIEYMKKDHVASTRPQGVYRLGDSLRLFIEVGDQDAYSLAAQRSGSSGDRSDR
jgi:hypothetical protein